MALDQDLPINQWNRIGSTKIDPHLMTTDFSQSCKDNSVNKEESFQKVVLLKLHIYLQINEM